ncbi:TIGR02996 domain-containing protein [Pyxidicoccus sp. QH1ED-7-1]|nr:TIGR02996 domain-containing protein [Pyxidicoccus xibeiensis]
MLLARVYAHPDDDSARLVLADHLLEQGDPLGEFIMLQCSAQPDEARIRELLAQHGAAWQAPLGPLVRPDSTRFERGFPAAVRGFLEWKRPAPGPAWGTVREINGELIRGPSAAGWFAHPHLHAVTYLRRMQSSVVPALGAYPLSVRRLELSCWSRIEETLFLRLSTLPHLTWVELTEAHSRDVALCASSPLASRLERFTARRENAWSLEATPSEAVTVSVTLLSEEGVDELAQAIRAAVGFGTRGLRLVSRPRLEGSNRRLLEEAAAAYAHIEWV